jgi:6,7-dimethyl-8-ribityllumazine synthase
MSSNFRSANPAPAELDGSGMHIAIVCGRFNDLITNRLLAGAAKGLGALGVADEDVVVVWVPGAFEIPFAAKLLAETGRYDAVIGLGAVIRGDTPHFEYVAGECARGLQDAQLATGVPIVFGVLTTENLEQAMERSGDDDNKGEEAARVAIEMADLARRIRAGA